MPIVELRRKISNFDLRELILDPTTGDMELPPKRHGKLLASGLA